LLTPLLLQALWRITVANEQISTEPKDGKVSEIKDECEVDNDVALTVDEEGTCESDEDDWVMIEG